ncbi:MAG TPA: hypothetical protein VM370_01295 [Candidatus Thermoplasmatota archaeon]|nr:hypothetical protein [Candidatus Thermoplasmatota archaeon]
MTNDGTFVDVAGHDRFCGSCTNSGLMVLVASDFACSGECRNYGVVIAAGESCFNRGGSVAICKASGCYGVPVG